MSILTVFASSTNYRLPVSVAFGHSGWLRFWDVFYYLAYQQNSFWPLESGTVTENLPEFKLSFTTNDFSRLAYGCQNLPDKNDLEAGRKLFRKLANQAHDLKLLNKISEDVDLNLNNKGAQACHRFELPATQYATEKYILKPNSFIERGWIRTVGNSTYAYKLLNLWLLENATPTKFDLTETLQQIRELHSLTHPALLKITKESSLRQQLEQAEKVLSGLGLTPTNIREKLEQPEQPATIFPATSIIPAATPLDNASEWAAILDKYARRNPHRTKYLLELIETNLLEQQETKDVWATLAKFSTPEDFLILKEALQFRAKVSQEGRYLSWQEVTRRAELLCDHRQKGWTSQKHWVHPYNRVSKLRYTEEKLVHEELFRPAFDMVNDVRGLSRWKMELWVTVPGFRHFSEQPENLRPAPATLKISLLDNLYRPILQDEIWTISPCLESAKKTVTLEKALADFRRTCPDPDFKFLQLQIEADPTKTAPSWFSLSGKLTYYERP